MKKEIILILILIFFGCQNEKKDNSLIDFVPTKTLILLKYHIPYQFNILTCITCVDFPHNKYRFKLVYDLLSIRYNIRLRIKTFTHELIGVESCDQLYFTAGWYECEI